MFDKLTSFGTLALVIAVVGVTLWVVHWLLIKRHQDLGNERMFPRQILMFVFFTYCVFVIFLLLCYHVLGFVFCMCMCIQRKKE